MKRAANLACIWTSDTPVSMRLCSFSSSIVDGKIKLGSPNALCLLNDPEEDMLGRIAWIYLRNYEYHASAISTPKSSITCSAFGLLPHQGEIHFEVVYRFEERFGATKLLCFTRLYAACIASNNANCDLWFSSWPMS